MLWSIRRVACLFKSNSLVLSRSVKSVYDGPQSMSGLSPVLVCVSLRLRLRQANRLQELLVESLPASLAGVGWWSLCPCGSEGLLGALDAMMIRWWCRDDAMKFPVQSLPRTLLGLTVRFIVTISSLQWLPSSERPPDTPPIITFLITMLVTIELDGDENFSRDLLANISLRCILGIRVSTPRCRYNVCTFFQALFTLLIYWKTSLSNCFIQNIISLFYSASGSSCHEDSPPARNPPHVWRQARISLWSPCLFSDLLAVWELSCFDLSVIVQ